MALRLSVRSVFGIEATYHKIAALRLDYSSGESAATVYSYASEEARATHCDPLQREIIEIPTLNLNQFEDPRQAVYRWMKSLDAWSNAEDA